MSRCLTERSVDHVVLERGETANSWRTDRWDSLRLLTPNWQTRLPGYSYQGDEPDGFMTMPEIIDYLSTYAAAISAPVEEHTEVSSVRQYEDGFVVTTSAGEWAGSNRRRSQRSVPCGRGPGVRQSRPGGRHFGHCRATIATLTSWTRAGCWWWEPLRQGCSWPTRSSVRVVPSPWRSAATSGSPGSIGAWTSCGGSTPPVSSTNATTRSTTSSEHATFRRFNCWLV